MASNILNEILFADDTSLLGTLCNFYISKPLNEADFKQLSDKINIELEKVQEWLNINKLSLNVKKTKYIIFKSIRQTWNPKLTLKLNHQILEQVENFCFLGLTINEKLSWKPHIQLISNKISRTIGVLNKMKRFLPGNILKIIYSSLILPRIYYCNLAWGHKPERMIKLQKKAVRIISNSKYNAHTEPLNKELELLNVTDIHILSKLKFFYRLANNQLPSYFWNEMFTEKNSRTRNTDPFPLLVPKTAIFSDSIRFSLPTLLKNTPPLVKNKVQTHSYKGYVIYAKKHLIRKYTCICLIKKCYICKR